MTSSVSNSIDKIKQEITAPNILLWGMVPALFVFVIIVRLAFAFGLQVTGTSTATVCKKTSTGRECQDKKINNMWKLLVLIVIALVVSISIGMSTYKLGIMYLNPKIGVGMIVADSVGDSLNGV